VRLRPNHGVPLGGVEGQCRAPSEPAVSLGSAMTAVPMTRFAGSFCTKQQIVLVVALIRGTDPGRDLV
jgi:hypothetical protein